MGQKLAIATTAYERKEELGGGFRGVVKDKRSGERYESPVLSTIQEARHWVRVKVDHLMGDTAWAPGYVYRPNWIMNVWIRDN